MLCFRYEQPFFAGESHNCLTKQQYCFYTSGFIFRFVNLFSRNRYVAISDWLIGELSRVPDKSTRGPFLLRQENLATRLGVIEFPNLVVPVSLGTCMQRKQVCYTCSMTARHILWKLNTMRFEILTNIFLESFYMFLYIFMKIKPCCESAR